MLNRTEADKHLDLAKEALDATIANLTPLVCEECWGYSDFSKEHRQRIDQVFFDLIQLKRKLTEG